MIIELDQAITKLRRWAESKDEILALAIYGSYAKGEQNKDSDLDIAVVISDPSSRDDPCTVFVCESNAWTREIASLLQSPKIHLEWFGGNETPPIKNALQEAKILVYKAELDNSTQ